MIDSGDAAKGFKSYDWWGTIRATAAGMESGAQGTDIFRRSLWDRWILRNFYVTGGGCRPFLGLHEPGRAIHDCRGRLREHRTRVRRWRGQLPVALRRTDHVPPLQAVVAGRVGRHGRTLHSRGKPGLPDRPDVVVEDCTLISPQCAMKGGNYGFHTYMRIRANRCRFITLNFSQPAGTPTDGVFKACRTASTCTWTCRTRR